jgi:hypothetical protein
LAGKNYFLLIRHTNVAGVMPLTDAEQFKKNPVKTMVANMDCGINILRVPFPAKNRGGHHAFTRGNSWLQETLPTGFGSLG